MNYVDHNPPHFHADYQGFSASFKIADGELLDGNFPKSSLKLIKDWTNNHRDELEKDWDLARQRLPLLKIPGADND